jgi:hypothetical protein
LSTIGAGATNIALMKHPTQLPAEQASELTDLCNRLSLELVSQELGFTRETTARLAARIDCRRATVAAAQHGLPRLRDLLARHAA